jgi:hypothetical protein
MEQESLGWYARRNMITDEDIITDEEIEKELHELGKVAPFSEAKIRRITSKVLIQIKFEDAIEQIYLSRLYSTIDCLNTNSYFYYCDTLGGQK